MWRHSFSVCRCALSTFHWAWLSLCKPIASGGRPLCHCDVLWLSCLFPGSFFFRGNPSTFLPPQLAQRPGRSTSPFSLVLLVSLGEQESVGLWHGCDERGCVDRSCSVVLGTAGQAGQSLQGLVTLHWLWYTTVCYYLSLWLVAMKRYWISFIM